MNPIRPVLALAAVLAVAACGPAAVTVPGAATGTPVAPAPATTPGATTPGTAAPATARSAAPAATVSSAAAPAHGLEEVDDPGQVTGTIYGHCAYRDGGQLPDPRCTPGSINPAVTQADIGSTICRYGWTSTVRPPESQTEAFKYDVAYPAYGAPQSEQTELDHLVPLELGGSNDATNLWPEHPPSPNPKDTVEDALNAAVCDGRVSLARAQAAIASDWMTAEQRLGLSDQASTGSGGSSGSGNSSGSEGGSGASCTASAAWDSAYHDYDVYVHSNQPDDAKVTATASNGASGYWWTDSTGYADVYLKGAGSGDSVKVTVGAATCYTST